MSSGRPETIAGLPDLLTAVRDLVARDCPAGADTAFLRITVLYALDSTIVLARALAALIPPPAADAAVVEVPRLPRFGDGDAVGPDRGLVGGRPHP